jgi:hypothetical protein
MMVITPKHDGSVLKTCTSVGVKNFDYKEFRLNLVFRLVLCHVACLLCVDRLRCDLVVVT